MDTNLKTETVVVSILAMGISALIAARFVDYHPISAKGSSVAEPYNEWKIFERIDKFEESKYSCFVYDELSPDSFPSRSAEDSLLVFVRTGESVLDRIDEEFRKDLKDCETQTRLKRESESCYIIPESDRIRYEYIVDDGALESAIMGIDHSFLVFALNNKRSNSSEIEYRVLMDVFGFSGMREEVIFKDTITVSSPANAWSQLIECERRELENK